MPHFSPHSLVLTTSGSPVSVPLASLNPNNNLVTAPDGAGARYDLLRSVVGHNPEIEGSTEAVAAILAAIGTEGQCLLPAGALRTLAVHQERKTDCKSGAAASDSHPKTLVDSGLVRPLTLSASAGQNARLSFRCDPIKDGVNDPFVLSTTTLPTTLDLSQYTLGAVRIGNIAIPDTQDLTLDFGIETEKTAALGSIHAETISVRKARPSATIVGRDLTKIDTSAIPVFGKSGTHANTEFWFKKRQAGGTFVADLTEEHFKLTMAGFVYADTLGDGSGDSNSQTRFMVQGVYDGTNAPIVASFGIAYAPGF